MIDNLHVLQIVGEPVGGIRKHVHSLLLGIPQETIRQSYAYSSSLSDLTFQKELPEIEAAVEGRLLPLFIKKRPCIGDISNILRLRKFVNDYGVSIVHGHGAKGGAYARLLKLLCNVKAVYTPHGGAIHRMFGRTEELLYTYAEKLLLSFTDYFLFESKYSADGYISKVGKIPLRWAINYNGIRVPDSEKIAVHINSRVYTPNPGTIQIGVFATLRPQKGQIYAIQAARLLAEKGVGFELHFFGDGPDREYLKREVSRMNLSNMVRFHGEVPDPESHMVAMDIILIPSLFESFGYVALEAFSVRRPVIATKVGGLREIIVAKKNGLLVNAGKGQEICDAVLFLMQNNKLCRDMVDSAFGSICSDFSIDKMIAGVTRVYGEIA